VEKDQGELHACGMFSFKENGKREGEGMHLRKFKGVPEIHVPLNGRGARWGVIDRTVSEGWLASSWGGQALLTRGGSRFEKGDTLVRETRGRHWER